MTEDMQVRNLSPHTQASYVQQVSLFARYFNKSPEVLGAEEIRAYQVYLTNERKLAPCSILIAVSALRFLYKVTLHKKWAFEDMIPAPKKPQTLPVVLSPEEVLQFLDCIRGAQRPFAQYALKSDLSSLVSMARDHEANGLPAGHEHYRLLYALACKKAAAYGELRGVDSEQLRAELASLEVLKRLAYPGAQHLKLGALICAVGIVLVPIAVGVSSGMVSLGYRWVLHLFGAH